MLGNAFLITKAVNNHEKLVEALRSIVDAHDNLLIGVDPERVGVIFRPAIENTKALLQSIDPYAMP